MLAFVPDRTERYRIFKSTSRVVFRLICDAIAPVSSVVRQRINCLHFPIPSPVSFHLSQFAFPLPKPTAIDARPGFPPHSREMLPEIQKLLILQDRDRKIRTLRQELEAAPHERREAEEKLAAAMRNLDAVKQKAKEIEVERKKLENEAQAKRDSIAKFQTQKFQTRKNEEFQALSNEITRYEGDIRGLEDRELEFMDQAEKVRAQVAETEQQTKALKTQVERQLVDIEAKLGALAGNLKEVEAERAGLSAGVDEDLLDTFDRLFANKGEAVVPLEHETCMGCHMKVTTQTVVKVKGRREIVPCEQCGRIRYLGN